MPVITFSRFFPKGHPRAGEPTFFVEHIYASLGIKIGVTKQSGDIPEAMWNLVNDFVLLDGSLKKHHTIRAGNRFKAGDKFSPRIWSGKPYASKQIQFAPDIEIKKIWDIYISECFVVTINGKQTSFNDERNLCRNDGLDWLTFTQWFYCHPKMKKDGFRGQIICWNESIEY